MHRHNHQKYFDISKSNTHIATSLRKEQRRNCEAINHGDCCCWIIICIAARPSVAHAATTQNTFPVKSRARRLNHEACWEGKKRQQDGEMYIFFHGLDLPHEIACIHINAHTSIFVRGQTSFCLAFGCTIAHFETEATFTYFLWRRNKNLKMRRRSLPLLLCLTWFSFVWWFMFHLIGRLLSLRVFRLTLSALVSLESLMLSSRTCNLFALLVPYII